MLFFVRFANQIQRQERKKQDELASGAIIQQSLLPSIDIGDELRGQDSASAPECVRRAMSAVTFDYFMLDADRVAFALATSAARIFPASLFMAVVVTTLRRL